VLAQADKNTLIVDCDMRRPTLHKVFGLRNVRGLGDILADRLNPREVWQEPLKNLKVILAGPLPYNPAELLGSKRFAEFLDGARKDFEYILMDVAPLRLVSDPLVLASQADGVLLVVDAQHTRKEVLRECISSLEAVEANVLGTVINRIKVAERSYHGEGYGYR
jgi:capsular exopolysaccharide synthesis family protein